MTRPLLLLALSFAAHAGEVNYTVDSAGFHVAGVSPQSHLLYDNDWWYDTPDKNYLWAMASLGRANLRANIVSRDLYNWSRGYRFQIAEQIADANKSIAIARRAGLEHIPDPVAGADRAFERPESGRIEDTKPLRSAGSDLIVSEARKATAERPLVILVGGPLNTVASAYLTDPSIAVRMIVFMTDLRGYNGQDKWANYIVATRCKVINYGAHIWWPQRPNPPVMPRERVKTLPANEMTDDLYRIAEWFWTRSTRPERPTRDDGFADGAPVFLIFDPSTWRNVKRQRVTGVFTVEDAPEGYWDLLDATEMDYARMTENFFHTLADPAVYHTGRK